MGLYEFSCVISSQLDKEAFLTQFSFKNHSGITRKIYKWPRVGFMTSWQLDSDLLSFFSTETKQSLET